MRVLGALVGVALLSGCTATPVVPLPDDPQKAIPVSASPEPEVIAPSPLPSATASLRPQPTADPELVASLECEPVSADVLERIQLDIGRPPRSVQVEAGEGNVPGETWWVIGFEMPGYEDVPAGPAYYLTDAPRNEQHSQWLELGVSRHHLSHQDVDIEANGAWRNVDWDADRLTRGHSALVKAASCLG